MAVSEIWWVGTNLDCDDDSDTIHAVFPFITLGYKSRCYLAVNATQIDSFMSTKHVLRISQEYVTNKKDKV